jgi:hypothetical protein
MSFLEGWKLYGIFTHRSSQPVAVAYAKRDHLHERRAPNWRDPLSEGFDPLIPSPFN